jgi:hypothetical protein
MKINHPLRGTCNDPTCAFHLYCHCGCGEETTVAEYNIARSAYVRGRPRVYRNGHHLAFIPPRGPWSKRGIPIARVRPLMRKLIEWEAQPRRIGVKGRRTEWDLAVDRLAGKLGVSQHTVSNILYASRCKWVRPEVAQRVVAVILARQPEERAHQARPSTVYEQEMTRLDAQKQLRMARRRGVPNPALTLGYESERVGRPA